MEPNRIMYLFLKIYILKNIYLLYIYLQSPSPLNSCTAQNSRPSSLELSGVAVVLSCWKMISVIISGVNQLTVIRLVSVIAQLVVAGKSFFFPIILCNWFHYLMLQVGIYFVLENIHLHIQFSLNCQLNYSTIL